MADLGSSRRAQSRVLLEFVKKFRALVGSILVGDTGDVEARSGAPRCEPAGGAHRGQRHAAVGALVFAKTLLQHVLHKLAVELVLCEL